MNLLPCHWLIIGYLGLTGVFILVWCKNVTYWYLHLVGRVLLILGVLQIASWQTSQPVPLQFMQDWYPLLTIPGFYIEMRALTQMVFRGYFDEKVIHWEKQVFKGMPSLSLSRHLPSLLISEFLHFCYLLHYCLAGFLPAWFYFQNEIEIFQKIVFAETCIIHLGLLWYPFFPCAGPRYLFEKIQGKLADGFFFKIAHTILEVGSSKGTAFPSSHVSLSMIILFLALRYDTTAFLVLLPLCSGLTLGTVYGRFHYAIDALAGFILAGIVFLMLLYV